MSEPIPTLETFLADARAWLDEHATRALTGGQPEVRVGPGRFQRVGVPRPQHRRGARPARSGQGLDAPKAERGYHAITAPVAYGGLGYPREFAQAFARLEREYVRPQSTRPTA